MGNGGFDPSLFHDDDGRKYYIYRPWGRATTATRTTPSCCRRLTRRPAPSRPSAKPCLPARRSATPRGAPVSPRGLVLPDGCRGRHQLRARGRGTAFQNIDGPYELHPDVTMMTSWHLPENPLQKSGHGSLLQTHTGNGTWPTSPAARCACPACRCPPAGAATARWGARPASPALNGATAGHTWKAASAQLTVKGPQMAEQPASIQGNWREDFDGSTLDPELQTLRIPFDDTLGSLTARPLLTAYGNDSLNSTFTQSTVARAGSTSPSGRRRGCSSRRFTSSRARADLLLQQQKLELLLCGLRGGAGENHQGYSARPQRTVVAAARAAYSGAGTGGERLAAGGRG